MAAYVYPEMPLAASVWFIQSETVPTSPPDATIQISLSPIRPEDFLRSTAPSALEGTTHIIRTAPDARLTDNYWSTHDNPIFPCSLFECPVGSGHYYATVWAHVVGAGFANEHARLYVARWVFEQNPPLPLFHGWI